MTNTMGRCALALAASAVLAVAAPAAAGAQTTDPHAGTQNLLNTYQSTVGGPGAAVFAGNAAGSWELTSGTGDVTANDPIQPDDEFRIASQTKTFTAATVLKLVDQGLVSLDAPIEQYLPGVVDGNGYAGATITVRELLQHTSGIAPNTTPNPQANPDGTYSLAALVADGLSHAPVSAPGAAFHYSNTNFQILGLLIEKVTGQPIGQAIGSLILTPLGLTETSYPLVTTLPAPYVHGYSGGRAGIFYFWYDTTVTEPTELGSAGGMVSSLRDVSRFEQTLINGQVLSPATLAQMHTTIPIGTDPHQANAYGLGLMEYNLTCGGQAWGHAGDLSDGYSSLTMVTADGRYASMITNTGVTATTTQPTRFDVLDSALCDMSAQ